jgi:hypothetical protein
MIAPPATRPPKAAADGEPQVRIVPTIELEKCAKPPSGVSTRSLPDAQA